MLKIKRFSLITIALLIVSCLLLCSGCSKNYEEPTDDEAKTEMHRIHDAIGVQLGTEDIEAITHLSIQDGVLRVTVDLSRLERELNEDEYDKLISGVDVGIKRGTSHNYYEKAFIDVSGVETREVIFK